MNKKIIVVLIALATVFSYAKGKGREDTRKVKEETMSFGARAGFVINSFTPGENFGSNEKVKIGLGFGGGFVLNYPLTDIFFFCPEVGLLYRTLYNTEEKIVTPVDEISRTVYVSEVAISIPLMIQVKPLSVPLHVAAGFQIDFPFSSDVTREEKNSSTTIPNLTMTQKVEDDDAIGPRKALDFGIALGLGYKVMPNLGIDLRGVIGLTSLIDSDRFKDSSLKQYGIGVSYFF